MTKPRIAISFSGGRSSAVMLKLVLEQYSQSHDISITFSNTGCEDPRTLDFVNEVDMAWANNQIHWIEAVINGKGKGPTAKRVDYTTAARNGEPFEAAIQKHGIPCRTNPQCTSRLKEEPMLWYRKEVLEWAPGTYDTAIGIRADEADRMSSKAKAKRLVYPLVSAGWTKEMVNSYMAQFPWDLKIPSDAWGNCVWCWKKSNRKLLTLAKESPQVFNFPLAMEEKYAEHKADTTRVFFRGRTTTKQLLENAQTTDFVPYSDKETVPWDDDLDIGQGCGESCEVGTDE